MDTQDFNEYAYSLFASFNHDKSDVISMDELFCGLSIQCRGNLAEKMHAIFEVFEKSGDDLLNRNELYAFLSGILKKLMQGVALP